MKHTTIKYDPILGAQMDTVEIPATKILFNQQQVSPTATATRMAIIKKQRANHIK